MMRTQTLAARRQQSRADTRRRGFSTEAASIGVFVCGQQKMHTDTDTIPHNRCFAHEHRKEDIRKCTHTPFLIHAALRTRSITQKRYNTTMGTRKLTQIIQSCMIYKSRWRGSMMTGTHKLAGARCAPIATPSRHACGHSKMRTYTDTIPHTCCFAPTQRCTKEVQHYDGNAQARRRSPYDDKDDEPTRLTYDDSERKAALSGRISSWLGATVHTKKNTQSCVQ